ncbi:MAG: hypothetical protein KBS44_07375 [Clostridiales bacterium]|nr:hypothetical protein [Candidatus Coliplasma equi]
MKKAAVVSIILSLALCLFISGCQSNLHQVSVDTEHVSECKGNLYQVHVDAEHVSECKMKSGYRCGEEVTIQLDTITEHYYKVFADGVEVPQDNEKTNMESTYFIFIMPDHDVELVIEDHDVDIPFAP